jgi:hypothetical protein
MKEDLENCVDGSESNADALSSTACRADLRWHEGDACILKPLGAFAGGEGVISVIGKNHLDEPFCVVTDSKGRNWHRDFSEIRRPHEE